MKRRTRTSRGAALAIALVLVVAVAGCLMRTPYFTDATSTSSTASSQRLSFATLKDNPTPVVTWGTDSNCSNVNSGRQATLVSTFKSGGNTITQWNALLDGLAPGTQYCYHLAQGSEDLLNGASPPFTTSPAPGSTNSYSFAVLGDFGAGTDAEANVLAQIRKSPAKFVVTVGDNVYNSGTQSEYGDVGQGNLYPLKYWPGGQTTPFFAVQGNHGFSGYQPYLQNFPQDTVAAASQGSYKPTDYCCISAMTTTPSTYADAYYAFDWGNARFYVLEAAWSDTNGSYLGDFQAHWDPNPPAQCAACGQELKWLQADLAKPENSAKLKFAFFHYPLHSEGKNQATGAGTDVYLTASNPLNPSTNLETVLANAGVKIAFNGHSHIYQRNLPSVAGKPMVSYIAGNGGADIEMVQKPCSSSLTAFAFGLNGRCDGVAVNRSNWGFLLVTVNGNQVTVTPTDENGQTYDVVTYNF